MLQEVEWSSEEYSLADFEYTFGKRLPQLVQVTDGFDGNELLHSFASEEMYLVYSLAYQSRVVVHDTRERLLSIPLDHQPQVRVLHNGNPGTPQSLKQTIQELGAARYSSNAIVFADEKRSVSIQKGGSELSQSRCGVMEIFDLLKQCYLIGFAAYEDGIEHDPVLIPRYVPIHLKVAESLGGDSEKLNQSLLKLIPAGLNFKPEDHFNTEIMAVSFADIDGDGYEYVNPESRHQTMSRITAKLRGLRGGHAQPRLSLPKHWTEASHELDSALNGGPQVPGAVRDSEPHTGPVQDRKAKGVSHPLPPAAQVGQGGDSRFLGAMRSLSMFDLSSGQAPTAAEVCRETPVQKYQRRSDLYTKPADREKIRHSAEQRVSDSHNRPNFTQSVSSQDTIAGQQSNTAPPKTKTKPKKEEVAKKKAKNWSKDTGKKYSVDTESVRSPWGKQRPSLRSAKSMGDLRMADEQETTFSVHPMYIIDRKPQVKLRDKDKKRAKNGQADDGSEVNLPKRKSMPGLRGFLSGLLGGRGGQRAEPPKVPPKPKKGKDKRKSASSDPTEPVVCKTQVEGDSYDAESTGGYSEFAGGSSIYASVDTVDLLLDINKAQKEGLQSTTESQSDGVVAPELPPRNNLPPFDKTAHTVNSQQQPTAINPDSPTKEPEVDSKCRLPTTRESHCSESGSFAFEFNPSSALYPVSSSGHLAEPESEGETSDSASSSQEDNSGGSSGADKDSINSGQGPARTVTVGDPKPPNGVKTSDSNIKPSDKSWETRVNVQARDCETGSTPVIPGLQVSRLETSRSTVITEAPGRPMESGSEEPSRSDRQRHPESGSPPPDGTTCTSLPRAPKPPVPSKPRLAPKTAPETPLPTPEHRLAPKPAPETPLLTPDSGQGPDPAPVPAGRCRYGSWDEIPSDISRLTVQDVVATLRLLKMTSHAQAFLDNDIDGELLAELDERVLQDEFQFSVFDAKKLVKFAKGWRPKLQS